MGRRAAGRRGDRAVSPACRRRTALFPRGGAADERTRRGAAVARGLRGGGPHPRLRNHAPGGEPLQPRRDRPLPQERLRGVRPPSQLLRGRRRCAAVREAAGAEGRARLRTALFSPEHRVHLWSGLHHDGAGLGRSQLQACAGLRVPALARSYHHLHRSCSGRLRSPTAWRSRSGATVCGRSSMSADQGPISSTP